MPDPVKTILAALAVIIPGVEADAAGAPTCDIRVSAGHGSRSIQGVATVQGGGEARYVMSVDQQSAGGISMNQQSGAFAAGGKPVALSTVMIPAASRASIRLVVYAADSRTVLCRKDRKL